jgi:hypothetical protein
MKDIFKVAGILLGGFTIGTITQALFDQKRIDRVHNENQKLVEKNNAYVDKNMTLQCELENCKVTNHQVATYACNLKKQLDAWQEGF